MNRALSTLPLTTSAVLLPFYKDIWVLTFPCSGPLDVYLQGECLLAREAWVLWNVVIAV